MESLLNVIAMGEANKKSPHGEYGGMYSGIKNAPDVSSMTIGQVKAFQKKQIANGSKSSAAGRYQILNKSMDKYQSAAGLSDDDLFSPENQNLMVASFIKKRAGDNPERIADVAASEFASVKNRNGVGNYDGKLNKASIERSAIVNAVKQPESFDPDAYLAQKTANTESFDPDAYLSERAQPAQAAPRDFYKEQAQGESFGTNLMAGIGGGMYGMYLGAKDMLGLASEQEVQNHKDAMTGLNSTAGGFIGDIAGQAAVMLPAGAGLFGAGAKYIPQVAKLATTLGGRTALAAAGGASQGALIPTTQDESRLGNIVFGAGVGAGANRVLEKGARALQKVMARKAAPPAISSNFQIDVNNYLTQQGIDLTQLSPAAKAKAQEFAYEALQAGASAKPVVNQAVLESLPVPMQGTKGQLGQDFLQQDNERVLADTFFGKPLRNRFEEQQGQLGQNLDAMIDRSGGTVQSVKQTGEGLQGEALKRYNQAKGQTKEAYKFAQDSAGDTLGKPSDNLIQWMDYNQGFDDVGGLITKAKKLGVITQDDNGKLIAGEAPLRNFYELRKTISSQSQNNGALAEAKGLVDDTFDAYGGNAYRAAAKLRREQGVTFEQGAKSVRDLVGVKKGTTDQAINREDVFNKLVINGNRDDIINVKKLLLSGNKDEVKAGQAQLDNLKTQTLQYFKENALFDTNGKTTFSLAKAEQAYKRIGEENLEEVLGKLAKSQLDDFMKAANIINRQQPRSAGNSATASRLANMAGSLFNILEKIPVVGTPIKVVGKNTMQAMQATGATQSQMKVIRREATKKLAAEAAGKFSTSQKGLTLKSLSVGAGQNLREE